MNNTKLILTAILAVALVQAGLIASDIETVPSLETNKLPATGSVIVPVQSPYPDPVAPTTPPVTEQVVPPSAYPAPNSVDPSPALAPSMPTGQRTWTVRRGDTIEKIARGFSINARDLVEENRLVNPNRIIAGKVLLIPAGANTFTIRRGDTLERLSRALSIPQEKLASMNGITNSNRIEAGFVLKLTPAVGVAFVTAPE